MWRPNADSHQSPSTHQDLPSSGFSSRNLQRLGSGVWRDQSQLLWGDTNMLNLAASSWMGIVNGHSTHKDEEYWGAGAGAGAGAGDEGLLLLLCWCWDRAGVHPADTQPPPRLRDPAQHGQGEPPLRVSQIVRWSLGQQCFQANISADEFRRKYKIYRQSVLQTKRFELRSQIETSQQPHRSHNIPVHIGR